MRYLLLLLVLSGCASYHRDPAQVQARQEQQHDQYFGTFNQ